MKPVFQTITDHCPDEGRIGNCMQAAYASIMELPLDAVPHFINDNGKVAEPDVTSARVTEFLKWYGMRHLWLKVRPEDLPGWRAWMKEGMDVYHLFGGTSPRGNLHVAVAKNGYVVHDPHPDGGEMVPDKDDNTFSFCFFVVADPAERLTNVDA